MSNRMTAIAKFAAVRLESLGTRKLSPGEIARIASLCDSWPKDAAQGTKPLPRSSMVASLNSGPMRASACSQAVFNSRKLASSSPFAASALASSVRSKDSSVPASTYCGAPILPGPPSWHFRRRQRQQNRRWHSLWRCWRRW